jgi:hypothetical protein
MSGRILTPTNWVYYKYLCDETFSYSKRIGWHLQLSSKSGVTIELFYHGTPASAPTPTWSSSSSSLQCATTVTGSVTAAAAAIPSTVVGPVPQQQQQFHYESSRDTCQTVSESELSCDSSVHHELHYVYGNSNVTLTMKVDSHVYEHFLSLHFDLISKAKHAQAAAAAEAEPTAAQTRVQKQAAAASTTSVQLTKPICDYAHCQPDSAMALQVRCDDSKDVSSYMCKSHTIPMSPLSASFYASMATPMSCSHEYAMHSNDRNKQCHAGASATTAAASIQHPYPTVKRSNSQQQHIV